MEPIRNIFLVSLLSFLLCACGETLSHEELLRYIQEPANGLTRKEEQGLLRASLTYRPADLLVWQELGDKSEIHDSLLRNAEERYDAYWYFILSLSQDGRDPLGGGPALADNLQKLSFELDRYVYAVIDQSDTIFLSDYYTPRLFGISGAAPVLLAFRKKGSFEQLDVIFQGFGGAGMRFPFSRRDIDRIPRLDFQPKPSS